MPLRIVSHGEIQASAHLKGLALFAAAERQGTSAAYLAAQAEMIRMTPRCDTATMREMIGHARACMFNIALKNRGDRA